MDDIVKVSKKDNGIYDLRVKVERKVNIETFQPTIRITNEETKESFEYTLEDMQKAKRGDIVKTIYIQRGIFNLFFNFPSMV